MSDRENMKGSNLSPPPSSTNEPSTSGVTTPDLIAEEKEQHPSSEQSIDGLEVPTSAEVYPTGKALIPILAALIFAVFLVAVDLTILGTAIPKITDEFGGLESVSWYGSAYFMTFGGFQPASGKFYKYFPLKLTFLGALAIFLVGSLICALAKGSTAFSKYNLQ